MKKGFLAIILMLVIIIGSISGCSANSNEKVVIWHNFLDKPAEQLQQAVEDYNKSIGKDLVEAKQFPSSGFMKSVNMAVKNGVGPDIVFRYPDDATDYISSNLVMDFLPYINDEEIGIANFQDLLLPAAYNEATSYSDGKMYSLPISITGPVVYYNKTIYDELNLQIPTTWAELYSNSKIIYENKGIAGLGIDSIADVMQMLIFQSGIEYLDVENRKVLFNTDEFIEEIDFFVDAVKSKSFSVTPAGDYWHNDFNNTLVSSFIGSSASEVYLSNNVDWGVFSIPQGEELWYPLWTRSAIVFKSTAEKERDAYLFLKYLIQPEINVNFRVMEESLSPYYATGNLDSYKAQIEQSKTLPIVQDSLTISGCIPPIEGTPDIRDFLEEMIYNILNGAGIEQELSECERRCNESLGLGE